MTNFCQHLVYNILNVILGEQFVLSPGPSQNRREDEFDNLIGYQRISLPKACQSEERRVGKGVDLGGRRIIKKKKKKKKQKDKKTSTKIITKNTKKTTKKNK